MIWPGRRSTELDADLPARAQAAAGRFAGTRSLARGGLTGAIVRVLGLRRTAAPEETAGVSADTEEVQMLREELVLELERAARRGAMAETERAGLQSTVARADSPVEQT